MHFFYFANIMKSTYHIAVSLIFINNQIFQQKTTPTEIVTNLQPVSRWLSGQVSSMFDKIAFCCFFFLASILTMQCCYLPTVATWPWPSRTLHWLKCWAVTSILLCLISFTAVHGKSSLVDKFLLFPTWGNADLLNEVGLVCWKLC